MTKTNCVLWDLIDHSSVREIYKEKLFYCAALVKESSNMNQPKMLCAHCCIRISQVIEYKKSLVLRGEITPEQLKRNPNEFVQYLPPHLKIYGDLIPELTGKNWTEIETECSRCSGEFVDKTPTTFEKATEITTVGGEIPPVDETELEPVTYLPYEDNEDE